MCSLAPSYILLFSSRKLKSKNKKTQNLVEYCNNSAVTWLLKNIIYSKSTTVTCIFLNHNCFRGTLQGNAFVCFDPLSYKDYLIRFVKRNQAEKIFKVWILNKRNIAGIKIQNWNKKCFFHQTWQRFFLILLTEIHCWRYSMNYMQKHPPEVFEKVSLKVSQNLEENTCVGFSFLIKTPAMELYSML